MGPGRPAGPLRVPVRSERYAGGVRTRLCLPVHSLSTSFQNFSNLYFIHSLHTPEGGILGLALLNATTLATQGRDGAIRVWALREDGGLEGGAAPPPLRPGGTPAPAHAPPAPTPLRTLPADSHSFCPLAVWVPEGWSLGGGGGGASPGGGQGAEIPASCVAARALALVAGRDGASAVLWDLDAASPLLRLLAPAPPGTTHDGGGAGGRGLLMGARFCVPPQAAGGSLSPGHALRAVTAHEDGTLCLWSFPDHPPPPSAPHAITLTTPLTTLTAHGDAAMSVALAPDGAAGVCGAADDLLSAFSVSPDGTALARLGCVRLPTQGVGAVALSVRGLAAAAGWDGATRLVQVEGTSLLPLLDLPYHAAPGAAAAFSADGAWLATGGRDGAIALWDVGGV